MADVEHIIQRPLLSQETHKRKEKKLSLAQQAIKIVPCPTGDKNCPLLDGR
jgi:hypothetical protein